MKQILLLFLAFLCTLTLSAQSQTKKTAPRSKTTSAKAAPVNRVKTLPVYTVADPVVYTDKDAFLDAVGDKYCIEEFNNYTPETDQDSTLTITHEPFSYFMEALPQGWLYPCYGSMSHEFIDDTLLVINKKQHISYFGGYFFTTAIDGKYLESDVTIIAGEYTYTYTPSDSTTFRGFVFSDTVPYFQIKGSPANDAWATVDSLIVGDHINFKPVIESTSSPSTAEDTPLTVTISDITASDIDGDVPLTLTVLNGDNYTVDNNIITPAENFNGTLQVAITVSDGILSSDTEYISVTVTEVNDAPVITSSAPVDAIESTPYTYSVIASDIDSNTLTYSLSGQPLGMEISSNVITWTPATGITTSGEVTLTVSDGTLTDIEYFTISVSPQTGTSMDPAAVLSLHPNPATSYVKIVSPVRIISAQIIDITGKSVLTRNADSQTLYIYEIEALPKGIYFVRIKTTGTTKVLKLIKQ